ncbi:TetR/AcrR family transcriptional regulator [Caloramator sp. E03]|uniref:TetR/AcrR family transcriptional regulator n=1 Tax=Caloramator sp. E03 TaxID=2576307 RepID=UPI00143D0CA1|nr:TetR/AcrR family transcriptional regulator [Caloramator sp. E03]
MEISRRERKKIKTKSDILRAARHLFEEKGYDDVSIEDITERSDVSKGTFFNYFNSKEGLLKAIAEEEVDDIQELYEREGQNFKSCRDRIKLIMKRLLDDSIPYMHLTGRVVFSTIINSNEDVSPFYAINEMIDSLVQEGQMCGEFSKEYPSKYIVTAILGAYYGLIFTWFEHKKETIGWSELECILDAVFKGFNNII